MLTASSRGTALVESVFFLPILLLALFGVIYLSQFGTLTQRVHLAVRYGALGQFVSGNPPIYSAANIYLSGTQPPGQTCPAPPLGVLTNSAPFPGPTAAPYWFPSANPAPTSSCTQSVTKLQGAQFLMSRYLVSGRVSVSASSDIPAYVQNLIGAQSSASATQNWVHAAWPSSVLACIKEVNGALEDMLTNMETVTLPTGWTGTSGC